MNLDPGRKTGFSAASSPSAFLVGGLDLDVAAAWGAMSFGPAHTHKWKHSSVVLALPFL
jgi:hypothetical protein